MEPGPHLLLSRAPPLAGLPVLLARVVALAVLSGCRPEGAPGDTAVESVEDGITTRRWSTETNRNGLHAAKVPVHAGQSAMLVCGVTDQPHAWVSLEAVADPSGDTVLAWDDWYDRAERLTSAIFPVAADSCVNWPVRAADGPLREGIWTVTLATTQTSGAYWGGVALDVVTQTRTDPASDGTLKVFIGLAGDLDQDADLADALDGAVARWAEIWAEAGVGLEVRFGSVDLPVDVPDPVVGDPALAAVADQTLDSDVLIVVGETIDGSTGLYGASGAVPGSLTASPRAAVVISWLVNAGGDAVFEDDEVQLLGETLAHEAGHFAGLLHPVEDGWDHWDALGDTPACSSPSSCEAELGDNVMFPYPLCNYVTCEPQGALTAEQAGVLVHYTGVR